MKQNLIPNTIKATVFGAACSVDSGTGGATLYKLQGDTSKEWESDDMQIPAPYAQNAAVLRGFISAIETIAREANQRDPSAALEITCVTYVAAIATGFNKNRETWEANGFITSRGNRVKYKDAWKELFLLADQYNITVKKPQAGSNVMKSCSNRAKMVVNEMNER